LKTTITQMDRDEGLIPYEPLLPILPKSFLNYYKRIWNIRGIETASAYLESTSLVFVYGLDLFFTRTAPSGTFDLLNPDFNYFALVATSVSLLIFTIGASWFSKRSDLKRLWR